jgi:hypothetical protein
VMAGLALAPACFFLANWLFKRFGDVRVAVPLPARWVDWLRGVGIRLPTEESAKDIEARS